MGQGARGAAGAQDGALGAVWGQRLHVCGPLGVDPLCQQDQQESGSPLIPRQGVHWAGAVGMLPSPGTTPSTARSTEP